jgi:hypothetical protein
VPIGDRAHDFTLENADRRYGFLLWRFGQGQGRAWSRKGTPDTASRRSEEDLKYSRLDDDIEFAAVYNDFSGGYGQAYRKAGMADTLHWSENMDVRFPRQAVHCQALQLLTGAAYASTNFNVEYLTDVPLRGVAAPPDGAGSVLAIGKGFAAAFTPTHLNTIGSMFDRHYEATGGGAITFGRRPATFGSYTYIGVTNGSSFYRRGHDGTYTIGPNQPAQVFLNAGDRLAFFWKTTTGAHMRTVAQGADPMGTANYSATINVGPGHLHPLDAIDRDKQIFVGMTNGLHAGDSSGTFVNVLPEISHHQHEHNAADLDVYNTEIQVPHAAGLWSYLPSAFVSAAREVGPANRGDRSPVHGHVHAINGLGPWLYAGLWTGTQSYILAGRDMTDGSRRWNIMQRLPHVADVHRIHFDSVTTASNGQNIKTRMWVATRQTSAAGATSPLYVCPIPKANDNPLAIDPSFTANYTGSARMDFGRDDRGAPGTPKVFRAVEVRADMLLSGVRYADVYYSIDGGTRTYLGRANDSPRSTIWFPGLNGNFVHGHDIEISLESYTASTNISPVYYEVIVRGAMRPRTVDEITAVVRIADNMRDRRGGPMPPAADQARVLRSMAATVNPVYMTDLTGAGSWVLVRPGIEENEAYQVGEEHPELQMVARMAVLDFTQNQGTTWDEVSDQTWNTLNGYTWAQVVNANL